MSLTPQAAILTDAHQRAQAQRGAIVSYAIARLWLRTVKADNLDETVPTWMRLALARIMRERKNSVNLTRRYYETFRKLELGPDVPKFVIPPAPELIRAKAETSLRVTGPIALQKKLTQFKQLEVSEELEAGLIREAMESAGRTSAAAAVRHALDGGRDLMREAGKADPKAIGWARVTRADPCWWCAMLASRGPVYGENAFDDSDSFFTGGGRAKVHDACQCTMEPSYSRAAAWPGHGRDFEALWISSTVGLSGKAAMLAFRRAIENR